MKHPVATTKNGQQVYVDLIGSKASVHIAAQPHILSLAQKLLATINATQGMLSIEHDFGRNIGNEDIVETTANDNIFYAIPLRQSIYTRFVKRKEIPVSSFVTILLIRDDTGMYELTDIWVGKRVPPMPGSKDATSESIPYWLNHAVVLGGQAVQAKTITTTAPY